MAYYAFPGKYRWIWLLIASVGYYLSFIPIFLALLVGVVIMNFFMAGGLAKVPAEKTKKAFILIITANVVILAFFKYFNFLFPGNHISLFNELFFKADPINRMILPLGLSYLIFTVISYQIEIKRKTILPEKHFGYFSLYLLFFPKIAQGPIERAKNMLPQFKAYHNLEYDMVVKGLKLMLWGYFMKLVVADRVGIYVDAIYNNIPQHNGTTLLFASFLYPFQVYADLGGYSLIAIGTANILGINVMQNFKRPFFATSMSEFWRRWHISLISWLTDYVYTPLSFAFRKYKVWGIVIALMITFFISGIWHGAALTFLVWGIMQGVFLSIEALTYKKKVLFEKKYDLSKKSWYVFTGIGITYILFTVSQVFGRSANLSDAFEVYQRIFTTTGALFIGSPSILIFSLFALSILFLKDFTEEFIPSRLLLFENKNKLIRVMAYSSVIILILLIGVFDGGQFIYFQF